MTVVKLIRLLGTVTVLACAPALVAIAQTQPPTLPQSPPASTMPDQEPQSRPAVKPSEPAQRPSIDRPAPDKNAAKADPLIGLTVLSSDGNRMGSVHSVKAGPDGKVTAIHIKTGGFLGLGGKLVAIPEGKFTRSGDVVQLGMTADAVSKLPEVKDQN